MERNHQRTVRRALWLARAIAIGVLLLAAMVLAGWVLDNPLLKGAFPGQVAMKANTAVGFGLIALALWLLAGRAASWRQRVALGFALVVAVLGAVSLIEYLAGTNLGIDQLLFREAPGAFGTSDLGRMAPLTAVCFVLLGTTSLWLVMRPGAVLAAQPLAVLAAVIGLLNLIGYLYGAEGFYKLGPYTPMAPPTAAAFLALGIGVLCARPDAGLMRTVTSGTPSSLIARRLLLAAVVLPVAFNWLEMQGQRAGFYDAAFGAALAAVAGSLVVIALIWSTARRLERGDRERRQAEQEYHTILQTAIDGFWVVDREGRLLEVNEAYCRMSGYSRDELLRMHIPDLDATDSPDEVRQRIGKVLGAGSDRFEHRHRRKDGSLFDVDISVQYLNLRGGVFIVFLQDITQRKLAQEALRQTNERLEQRVRERTAALEQMHGTLRKSEERFRSVAESAADAIVVADSHGNIMSWNMAAQVIFGYSESEVLGKSVELLMPERYREAHRRGLERFSSTGRSHVVGKMMELSGLRKDRREFPMELSLGSWQTGDERFFSSIIRDITERKQAERDLRLQSSALASAANAIMITDLHGIIQWINPAFTRLTGYAVTEALGRNPRDLVKSGEHDDAFFKDLWATILSGRVWKSETINRRKDGALYTEFQTITPVQDEQGQISHFIAIKEDITERKQAEAEKLLIGEIIQGVITTPNLDELFKLIHHSISKLLYAENCFVALHDPNTDLMHFEFWVDKLDPCPPPLPVGIGFGSYVLRTGQSLLLDRELVERMYQSGEVEKSGSASASWLGVPLRTHSRTIGVLVVQHYEDEHAYTQRDLELLSSVGDQIALAIEHKRAEAKILKEQLFSESIINSLPGIFYLFDQTGKFLLWNKNFEQITGYSAEEIATLSPLDLFVGEEKELIAQRIQEVFASGASDAEAHLVSKSGQRTPYYLTGVRIDSNVQPCLIGVGLDLAERKQVEKALRESEEQLRQSQKMEAIGQLAGGVAHDFNNLLTAINGYSGLALQRIDDNHPLKGYLEEIKKAGDRAANLTRQLLAFGRKQILQPLAINLNDVVSDMNKMLRRLIGEDIHLCARVDPALKTIKADPGQIEQVLVNLVVNARDAMPQGGTLTIETSGVDLDEDYAHRHVGVVPGRFVMLAVSDTGIGMDEETQARIFDPFFTTKERGKGTGLGLSTVYGIVKQSGGNIWVYSELGHGTTFKVYLPELAGVAQKDAAITVEYAMPGGSETILLVEDEEVVRSLARKILENVGYSVLEASRGQEAMRLCLERTEPIDLLLTDVVMPETSGKEVADRLSEMQPGLRVLFMSGYTDESIVHHGVLDLNVEFIQKPFTPSGLTKKVREVLDSELMLIS